jgi:hypothetical protein
VAAARRHRRDHADRAGVHDARLQRETAARATAVGYLQIVFAAAWGFLAFASGRARGRSREAR